MSGSHDALTRAAGADHRTVREYPEVDVVVERQILPTANSPSPVAADDALIDLTASEPVVNAWT